MTIVPRVTTNLKAPQIASKITSKIHVHKTLPPMKINEYSITSIDNELQNFLFPICKTKYPLCQNDFEEQDQVQNP